jgi:multicomponent Na+:H+ antiporter subunit A
MVALFATSGAPDLALTQILVETVTLVAFALVLRRIPARMGEHNASVWPSPGRCSRSPRARRWRSSRSSRPDRASPSRSRRVPDLAYELGHGKNVVNVALVDLRGWDTMGELSVLILAATGVASLVSSRTAPTSSRARSRRCRRASPARAAAHRDGGGTAAPRNDPDSTRQAWLVGGQKVRPENRSILLEVIVRILFHTIIVVSIYLLFAGHNLPGGGFAGGLVAGMALVMRYVAGGRYELGAAAPTDAGRLLGGGMTLAVATAVVPLLFGAAAEERVLGGGDPVIGHIEFVTSTLRHRRLPRRDRPRARRAAFARWRGRPADAGAAREAG